MPPPPPPPGPPPAPGPPPPPTFNQANTQPPKLKKTEAVNRNALLGSIENFRSTGLKKTKHLMVDKSAPAVAAGKGGGTGPAAGGPKVGSATVGRSGAGNRVQAPQGLGGLFAGGMPQLKSTSSRFSAETSNNNTGSPGAHRPGVGNRFGGNANHQQFSSTQGSGSVIKRHPSAGDIQNIAKHYSSNQGPPTSSNQRPSQASSGGGGGGGVRKWPPVSTGGAPTNGQLGNHGFGGQHEQSAMPPPPPSSTNRPNISQFSRNQTSQNTNVRDVSNNVMAGPGRPPAAGGHRNRPLPDVPNITGGSMPRRGAAAGGGGGGGTGGAPPPPPPARTEQTNLRRKSSSSGGTSSNGTGSPRPHPAGGNVSVGPGARTSNNNRPLPPTPSQPPAGLTPSVRPPPPPPARNPARPQQSPVPPRQQPVGMNYRPSRPSGGAPPPPPPPTREPGPGGPPPPPPRVGPGQMQNNLGGYNHNFERQFKFTDINMLPLPEPFSNKTKTYPSKNPKNPAAHSNGSMRRMPSAH